MTGREIAGSSRRCRRRSRARRVCVRRRPATTTGPPRTGPSETPADNEAVEADVIEDETED